jgi:hypothetical protein
MNPTTNATVDSPRPRRTRRSFTHAERVAAVLMLNDAGASIRGTACQLGIPETTLRRWVTGERAPSARTAAPAHREQLSEMLQDAFWACAGLIDGKVGHASLAQCAKAMGIFLDKMIQLRWRPVPNPPVVINVADFAALTPAEREELASILRKAGAYGPTPHL